MEAAHAPSTTSAVAAEARRTASFLDLVEDVRRLIYAELLVSTRPYKLRRYPSEYWHNPAGIISYGLHPNILRTCRMIYDEALPLLYSNTIRLPHEFPGSTGPYTTSAKFIERIGTGARFVRHLELYISNYITPRKKNALDYYGPLYADLESIGVSTSVRSVALLGIMTGFLDCDGHFLPNDPKHVLDKNIILRDLPNVDVRIIFQKHHYDPTQGADFIDRHRSAGWIVEEKWDAYC